MVDSRSTGESPSNTCASTRRKLGLGVGSTDTVTAKAAPALFAGHAGVADVGHLPGQARFHQFVLGADMGQQHAGLAQGVVGEGRGRLQAGRQRDGDDGQRHQDLDQREAARLCASLARPRWSTVNGRKPSVAMRRLRSGRLADCSTTSCRPMMGSGPSCSAAAPSTWVRVRQPVVWASVSGGTPSKLEAARRRRTSAPARRCCAIGRARIPARPPASGLRVRAAWPAESRSAKLTPAVAMAMIATTTSSSSSVKPRGAPCAGRQLATASCRRPHSCPRRRPGRRRRTTSRRSRPSRPG